MLTYKKGTGTKFIQPGSALIPIIEKDGWKLETPEGSAPTANISGKSNVSTSTKK